MRAKEIENIHVFAYGHNTNTETIKHRCPNAKLVGTGVLENFEMTFNKFSNIQNHDGHKVYGIVWSVSHRDLLTLDNDEDLHQHYNRIPVEVHTKHGTIAASAYVMDPDYNPQVPPPKDYVNHIVQGYKEHGLPVEQIKQALQTKNQTGE